MALSAKQKAFVNEYLQCWNASEAARRAGYSEKTAGSIGHENLKKPEISEEIARRVADQTMTADEVLIRLADHARADIKDFLAVADNGDTQLDITKAQGKTHLIKKVTQRRTVRTSEKSQVEETVLTLELHDAQAALVQIGKHHKLFADKLEVEHSGSADISADERAQAAKELEEWQRQKQVSQNPDATSNG